MLKDFRLLVNVKSVSRPPCLRVKHTRRRGSAKLRLGLVRVTRCHVQLVAKEVGVGRHLLYGAQGAWGQEGHDVLRGVVREIELCPVARGEVLQRGEAQVKHEVCEGHAALVHPVYPHSEHCPQLREAETYGEADIIAIAADTYGQCSCHFVKGKGIVARVAVLVCPERVLGKRHQDTVRAERGKHGTVALLSRLENVLGVVRAKAEGAGKGCAGLHSGCDEGGQCLQPRSDPASLRHVHHLKRTGRGIPHIHAILAQGVEVVERGDVLEVVVPSVNNTDHILACPTHGVERRLYLAVVQTKPFLYGLDSLAGLGSPALVNALKGVVPDLGALGELLRQTIVHKLLIDAPGFGVGVQLTTHTLQENGACCPHVLHKVGRQPQAAHMSATFLVVGTIEHMEGTLHEVSCAGDGGEQGRVSRGELAHEGRGRGGGTDNGTGVREAEA